MHLVWADEDKAFLKLDSFPQILRGICFFTANAKITPHRRWHKEIALKADWVLSFRFRQAERVPWPSITLCQTQSERSDSSSFNNFQPTVISCAGGARDASSSHSPKCRRICSITSVWRSSMKPTIFISPPHLGQTNGSISYTCLISAAQRFRASLALCQCQFSLFKHRLRRELRTQQVRDISPASHL